MADQTERLLLQVDASIELLRRHMADGEQPLDRFEKRAAKTAERVNASIGNMGGRFGNFARLADDAATRAQRSFEASFSQIEKLAATAIKGPTIAGGINLGADDIRAGAAAAQDQARAYALIGEAAERAAQRTGDTSEATRLFIQATAAARIEAEQKASALLAEAGALERVEIELRQSAEATDLFVTKHQRVADAVATERQLAIATAEAATRQRALAASADLLRQQIDPMYLAQKRFNEELDRADELLAAGIFKQREYDDAVAMSRANLQAHAVAVAGSTQGSRQLANSQGAVRAAMQGASYQVQDTFTQLSMGANIFQVVAIQGGQLAGQFANIEGKAGSFARFMIGPYGLAITAALLVMGPLVDAVYEFATANEKATEAQEAHRRASEALDEAVRRLSGAQAVLNHSTRQGIIDDLNAAEAKRQHVLQTRKLIDAQLEEAKGRLNAARVTQATQGGTLPGVAGFGQETAALRQIAAIEGAQRINDRKRQESERAIAAGRSQIVLRDVAGATDKATAATQRYEDAIDKLQRKFERGGFGDVNTRGAQQRFQTAAEAVTRQRDASIEAAREDRKKGPSAATLARRAETARQKVLSDDIAFNDQERRARRALVDATRRTTESETERDALIRDEINADADAEKRKIDLQQSKGQRSQAEADQLRALNESTRKQRLQNVDLDRAKRLLERQFDAKEGSLDAEIATLRLQIDIAATEAQRRTLARQLLAKEQERVRLGLERVRDTSDDPGQVDQAKKRLAGLPAQEGLQRDALDRQDAGALEQYRDRLKAATDDMQASLQGVAVNGFGAIEDAGSRATASAITDMLKLRGVAGEVIGGVIADLARLAIQKAIVKAIGGGFLGLAEGGRIGDLPGFAEGGSPGGLIQGPGTGTSDSILAVLGGGKGAIRVSTDEYIVNARSTREYLPLIEAINSRTLPRFASGGAIGNGPSLPSLRSPSLPREGAGRLRDQRLTLDANFKVDAGPELDVKMEGVALRTVGSTAEPIMLGAVSRTMRRLNRPDLPGSPA